jgi:hypothetical protein
MKYSPDDCFSGPLFLVGMPRSGTKLLRGMLNEHSQIRFADIETEFLPYWVSRWPQLMPTGSPEQFRRFYSGCLKLPFFVQIAEQGFHIDSSEWFDACETLTPAGVFEGLMRCCLSIPRSNRSMIWGDKSPSYIRHIALLTAQFPTARVIHIVRDVRDYCLSIHKAWGKNILRAAQRWQDDVANAQNEGRKIGTNYIEVRYEDLLADPRPTLEAIAVFAGVTFEDGMLDPGRAVENLGAARNIRTLVRSNVDKYLTQMSPELVEKIEKIAGPTLRKLGYPCVYLGAPERIAPWRLLVLQGLDGINLIKSGSVGVGLTRSVKFHLAYFRSSGNRKY